MRYSLHAGLIVIRQYAKVLITEEPYDRMGHVRICGGRGWRQPLLPGTCHYDIALPTLPLWSVNVKCT
jgi:hypothetical protein